MQLQDNPDADFDKTNVDHVRVYQDIADQWRWSAMAGNNQIVAVGEAHTRQADAERAARGVLGEKIEIVYRAPGIDPPEPEAA